MLFSRLLSLLKLVTGLNWGSLLAKIWPILASIGAGIARFFWPADLLARWKHWAIFNGLCLILVTTLYLRHECPKFDFPIGPVTIYAGPTGVDIHGPNGTTHLPKPIGSTPTIGPDGKIHIPQWGFKLNPKAGVVLVPNEKPQLCLGLWLAYYKSFELEALGNKDRAFLGLAFRPPYPNLLTISVGGTNKWSTLFKTNEIIPYLGLSVLLHL
jgi:hypothetical protein